MSNFKTILVTTDFSDTSKHALPVAFEMARKYEAKVVLAYVEEDHLPPLVVEYAAAGYDDILKQQRHRAAEQLKQIANDQFKAVPTTTRVATGAAHVEIVELAREIGADLIVMATHGRGFFSHAVLGSTTERVVRRAPCPVLIVRKNEKE